MLDPDHGHGLSPRPLDEIGDVRDDPIAVVRPFDGVVLHVDDEQCGVWPVFKDGHTLFCRDRTIRPGALTGFEQT